MLEQHIRVNVVLPFLDATRRAGIPVTTMARVVGVSRATLYFWEAGKFAPNESRQARLLDLTERLNAGMESGVLPFSLNSSSTVRRLLGIDRT